MVAVYSQRAEAAQAAAREHGIAHVAASLADLVNHPEVDLVLVLTTGPQHEKAIRAAIAAGKDVYCEWPLTPNAKTTAELVELARAAGLGRANLYKALSPEGNPEFATVAKVLRALGLRLTIAA